MRFCLVLFAALLLVHSAGAQSGLETKHRRDGRDILHRPLRLRSGVDEPGDRCRL